MYFFLNLRVWKDFLSFTFRLETMKKKIDRLDSMKIEKISDKSGKYVCSTHDKQSYIQQLLEEKRNTLIGKLGKNINR